MTEILQRMAAAQAQLCQPGSPFELESVQWQGETYRRFKNAPTSLRELLDAGRSHGDTEFLVYQNQRWSFAQYFSAVDNLAARLISQYHVQPGQRIAIAMSNRPEWLICYHASLLTNAIVVPLNSWSDSAELKYCLTDCEASILFCDQRREQFIDGVPHPIRIVVDELAEDGHKFAGLIAPPDSSAALPPPLAADAPAQILYTSGTSGRPKGVLSLQENIIQAILCFEFQAYCSAMANPDAMTRIMAAPQPSASLLVVPLFHVSGCYANFYLNLRGGRKIVFMEKWDANRALDLIRQEQISIFGGVPTLLQDLQQCAQDRSLDDIPLYSIGCGGAALPFDLQQQLQATFGAVYFGTGYGMTETNAIGASVTGEVLSLFPNTVGMLAPLMELKTCDENGIELAHGEIGEIYLRSICNSSAYWQGSKHSHWFASGDIGHIDGNGLVFIADRSKDLIIRGGENISPREVEQCLEACEGIIAAAVIGIADERLGEMPAAVLQCVNKDIDIDAIALQMKAQLAAYKLPVKYWISTDEMPRNAAGKLLKRELKIQYGKSHQAV